MIPFDTSLLTIQIVNLKQVTAGMTSGITFVDETKAETNPNATRRLAVPFSVARDFSVRYHKVTRYLNPVKTAVVMYGDMVIALERDPLGTLGEHRESFDGTPIAWTPNTLKNVAQITDEACPGRNTYFDGRYVYWFASPDFHTDLFAATHMTVDGKFRSLVVTAFDMQRMHAKDRLVEEQRSCVAYVAANGEFSISPPIWKDVQRIGGVGTEKDDEDESDDTPKSLYQDDDEELDRSRDEGETYNVLSRFDDAESNMAVNLNFALKAGAIIGRVFGYQAVEPLELPQLMVQLRTVNLPSLPKHVKQTCGIPMTMLTAFAWLLGLLRQTRTLEELVQMRQLITYLTRKGIFRHATYSNESVFWLNKTSQDVKRVKVNRETQLDQKIVNGLIKARSGE